MNTKFKSALIERFGTQAEAAKAVKLQSNQISYLVRGHRLPGPTERRRLEAVFGKYKMRKFFPGVKNGA